MKKWILLLLVLLIGSSSLFAATDQFVLENNLTSIGQKTMDSMYGPDNFVVRVSVDLSESQYAVKYTQQSKAKVNKETGKAEQVYILPGVPALKNLAPDAMNKMPFDSLTTLVNPRVRKIVVYVLANNSLAKGQVRKAEPILFDVLGLVQGRDSVNFVFKPFYGKQNEDDAPSSQPGQPMQTVNKNSTDWFQMFFNLVFASLGVIFLIIYGIYQTRMVKAVATSAGKDSGGSGPSVNVSPNFELPKGSSGSEKSELSLKVPKIKKFFDFIDDDNVETLITLLKREKMGADYIGMIVAFMPPHLTAKVLDSLSTEDKAAVATMIVDQKLANQQVLEKLEAKLKGALECYMGGEKYFQAVFESIKNTDKKSILSTIQRENPEAYSRIRKVIVLFGDLNQLDDDEWQLLLSNANIDLVAKALVGIDQDTYQRINNNLTKNGKTMVSQYLELKGEATTKRDVEAAQDYLVKVAKTLDESGKIDLKSKLR